MTEQTGAATEDATPAVTHLPTNQLEPNDYNPNRMSAEEFAELVEEVRHLGRLPKPVVVRPAEAGYLIVDGEHGWRAATEAGLGEVACEIIDADDFEAMRQTYKRNQHGTHDRAALGEMFKRMTKECGISNRELAKEINVSEGTIRNALMFAEAAESRRRFSPEKGATKDDYYFSTMTTKQARDYMYLPEGLRDRWLNAGAPPVGDPETWGMPENSEAGYEYFEDLVKSGIAEIFAGRGPWADKAKRTRELMMWRSSYSRLLGDDVDAYIRPVVRYHSATPPAIQLLEQLPMRDGKTFLTPEEGAEAVRIAWGKSEKVYELLGMFKDVAKLKAADLGIPADDLDDPRAALMKLEVERDAPAFLRDAPLPLRTKHWLFKDVDHYYDGRAGVHSSGMTPEERLRAKQMAVKVLVEAHKKYEAEEATYERYMEELKKLPPEQYMQALAARLHGGGGGPKYPTYPPPVQKAWVATVKAIGRADEEAEEQKRKEALKATFEEPEKVADAIVQRFNSAAPKMFGQEVGGKAAWEVLRERLDDMPVPEMLLLGAVMLKAPVSVWLEAVREEVERELAREA